MKKENLSVKTGKFNATNISTVQNNRKLLLIPTMKEENKNENKLNTRLFPDKVQR